MLCMYIYTCYNMYIYTCYVCIYICYVCIYIYVIYIYIYINTYIPLKTPDIFGGYKSGTLRING